MRNWRECGIGLIALAGLASGLRAQFAAPSTAAVPPAAAPAAGAPAAGGGKMLGMLAQCKAMKEECIRKLCKTPMGQLLNNSLKPASLFSGGLISGFCPTVPNAADLAKPGAAGAAAKIQKDEAEAKERRAAVRYLGTVDCHYWPEAEEALILSLRADTNECVRLEAALVLGSGCCCTKRTIEALTLTVSGSSKDGNPSENSERVRAVASGSLQHCLACYREEMPIPQRPEQPPGGKPVAANENSIQLAAYYTQVRNKPAAQVLDTARSTLARAAPVPAEPESPPTGRRNLYHILIDSRPPRTVPEKAPSAPPQPPPPPAKNPIVPAVRLIPETELIAQPQ